MTSHHGGIVIYDAAGTVAMNSIEVESSRSGILILYDANVKRNSRLTIADSLIHFNDFFGLSVILDKSKMYIAIEIVRTVRSVF